MGAGEPQRHRAPQHRQPHPDGRGSAQPPPDVLLAVAARLLERGQGELQTRASHSEERRAVNTDIHATKRSHI